jgi:diguanylate cyclase (GGDEF)-like protein
LLRPTADLAAFWPVNAILLGLFVRAPRFACAAGWISAVVGFVACGLIAGDPPLATIILSAANMLSVVVGYLIYRRHDESIRHLKRPRAIWTMAICVAAAGTATGVAGAVIDPILFHGTIWHGASFWFVTTVMNHIAILPVILSAPDMSWRWQERRQQLTLNIDLRRSLPIVAAFLSCGASVLIGGPGAAAFPLPALLWCSVTYTVFTTSLLTLGFSVWTLIAISTDMVNLSVSGSRFNTEMSIRIGIALLALAPLSLAIVMETRNELMRRLLDIASRDQLTGLLNRHAFRERSNTLLSQLGLDGKPVSLLMINIDHFRSINDTHGYAAGDRALNSFSRIVSACLRDSDVLSRLGGEEFAVLLPDCSHTGVTIVAERIRKTIAETAVDLGDNLQQSITVSIGAVSALEAPLDIEPLLFAADSALYRAKKTGRNKVIESKFQSTAQAALSAAN